MLDAVVAEVHESEVHETGAAGAQARPAWTVRLRREPVAWFVAIAAGLWAVVWATVRFVPRSPWYPFPDTVGVPDVVQGWSRFDGLWYARIAVEGYWYTPGEQSPVAFFPLYPMVSRAVAVVAGDAVTAGVVVTVVAGAAAVWAYSRWCRLRLGGLEVTCAVLALCLYPYAFYLYGAHYAEALFLAVAVGAFLALERDRLWLAVVLGAAATAGRNIGVAVAIGLVLRLIERRNDAVLAGLDPAVAPRGWRRRVLLLDPRALRRADARVAGAFAGIGLWCAYLWVRFGDPFVFSAVQGVAGWDQPSGTPTWLKFRLFEELAAHPDEWGTWAMLAQALIGIGFVLAVPWVVRRFGWAYGAYSFLVLAVPMVGSKDFHGVGRYVLPAFPVFALVGIGLAHRRWLRWPVLAGSAVLLPVMAFWYARGIYLA